VVIIQLLDLHKAKLPNSARSPFWYSASTPGTRHKI